MTSGRPREFDTERALDAAMHLFWRKGFESTSMQDLLDTMHLSKSSLYQTYGSKHELFQQCLSHYRDTMSNGLSDSLAQSESGYNFIAELFHGMVENASKPKDRIGCLVMNTASEFAQRDKVISRLVAAATDKFLHVLTRAVEQAQQDGDIAATKDPQRLARFLLSNMSGLNTMIKAGMDKAALHDIVSELLRAIK